MSVLSASHFRKPSTLKAASSPARHAAAFDRDALQRGDGRRTSAQSASSSLVFFGKILATNVVQRAPGAVGLVQVASGLAELGSQHRAARDLDHRVQPEVLGTVAPVEVDAREARDR